VLRAACIGRCLFVAPGEDERMPLLEQQTISSICITMDCSTFAFLFSLPGECAGDLQCRERNGSEPVPGCTGLSSADDGIDFCYDPNDDDNYSPKSSKVYSGVVKTIGNDGEPASSFPLGWCESDCDDDSECQTGLVCYERSEDSDMVPGCTGEPDGDSDYCVNPADIPVDIRLDDLRNLPQLEFVGDDWKPSNRFPLGLCQVRA